MARVLIPIGLVVVVVLVLVLVKVVGGSSSAPTTSATDTPAPAGIVDALQVPASTFATVGVPSSVANPPKANKPAPAILTANGKPQVVYVGAEYCPYCAAERWAIAVALYRFGTFSGLKTTTSSATDTPPSVNTLSFFGSTYTSPYLTFTATEETTNQPGSNGQYQPLETPSALETQLLTKYDSTGGIPFIDFGNRYIASTTYSPQVLQGKTWSDIAAALSNPSDPITQGIVGSANVFTATICQITNDQPASVCSAPEVQAAKSHLS